MTRMLASVADVAEAALALAGGADIIDLKNPADGALGAVAPDIVRATITAVAGKRPVSAVAGNLPMQPDIVRHAVGMMAETGADYVKLGIVAGGDPHGCIRAVAPFAGRTHLVAVLFADQAPNLALLPALAEAGFAGAMLDTQDKASGRLLMHRDLPALRGFVSGCTQHGLFAGLAGGLEPPDVPRLLLLSPAFLGFRGALCEPGGRAAALSVDAVRRIRALIPLEDAAAREAGMDYRLLAPGYAPDPSGDPALHDRVFVHDMVLPVQIGAYAHEHAAPQDVRFNVDAIVARPSRIAADMTDVFSYDLITDGIRLLIADAHFPFVETLAEQIAAMLLAHPGVVRVMVTVEKLQVGPGRVGVTIERTR